MPDADPDTDGIDAVASDGEIYARVSADIPGVVTSDGERPNLPDFHNVVKSAIENGAERASSIDNQWLVGREGDHVRENFEVWIPSSEVSVDTQTHTAGTTGRFEVESNSATVTVGADVDQHYATELFWVAGPILNNAYNEPIDTGTRTHIPGEHSVFDVDEEDIVSSIPDELIDHEGEWIRGADTDEYGSSTTYEIFVPHDEFVLENGAVNPKIRYTEHSVTRKHRSVSTGSNVTERQSGLYVDQIQAVSEDAVPDTTDDFVGGTVYTADGEQ
jgi:hypothetical protein